jgi:Tfp pilus assembly PilM family ATPase
MSTKPLSSIGLDFDSTAIRGARIELAPGGSETMYVLKQLEQVRGSFTKDEALISGLKQIRDKLQISAADRLVTCVSGKQVYAAQMPFKKLPAAEMKNALRIEIRKSLPFESSGSIIEYQPIDGNDKADVGEYFVTAVANILLDRHLQILGKAGLKPSSVDVLPAAVANTLYAGVTDLEQGNAYVMIHVGPSVCTLVIDGRGAQFFHRTIYFVAEEMFGEAQPATPLPQREWDRRMTALGDEVVRSISFYEKSYRGSKIGGVYLLGDYAKNEHLKTTIQSRTGLYVNHTGIASQLGNKDEAIQGIYEIALALALRN